MRIGKTIVRKIELMGFIGLIIGLMMGCSYDDCDELQLQRGLSLQVIASASGYENISAARGVTRSWEPPTNYWLYDDLYTDEEKENNYQSLTEKAIDVFFTRYKEAKPLHGRLAYNSTNGWQLGLPNTVNPDTISAADYYLYGFIPNDAADSATIERLGVSESYANGAKLTIHGLRSITSDACVIIGAKEGPDADHDSGLRAGDFKFHLNTGESVSNYLYLLFDHLCAALSIGMKVDGDYNALRTIKLKSISLQTSTAAGRTKKKMNMTITLKKNNDGSIPFLQPNGKDSISVTPVGEELSEGVMFQSADGLALNTSFKYFMGYFLPQDVTKITLTCTYDVYDKNTTEDFPDGNLIRKDCKATNTLDLTTLMGHVSGMNRAHKYTINMTIQPTYLYMLSEPDLDNPTVVVN